MIGLKVEVRGLDEVRAQIAGLQAGLVPQVMQPALNKVAEKARAEINRAIPQEFAVSAADVRSAVDLRRAMRGTLEAVIEVFGSARRRGRSLNLIHFLASSSTFRRRGIKKREQRALGQQLGFLIKKGGGLKTIPGAFIGNKGRTIFRRIGKSRLPIEPLQVIGFSQMFSSNRIRLRVLEKIRAELPIEVDRAIRMVMERGR